MAGRRSSRYDVTANGARLGLVVALTLVSIPLACGDGESPPTGAEAGSGGSGAEQQGGSGGAAGEAPGGGGTGEATGGSAGGKATGGSEATGGAGGKATGGSGAGGTSSNPGGDGGATDGGMGGAAGEGAAGEGGVDEETARCERICEKAQAAMCEDMSTCVLIYCDILLNPEPACRRYADALRVCLDERGTAADFACDPYYGLPWVSMDPSAPCWPEVNAGDERGCL